MNSRHIDSFHEVETFGVSEVKVLSLLLLLYIEHLNNANSFDDTYISSTVLWTVFHSKSYLRLIIDII